jgi:type I restriction enzyme S subunit
MPENWKTYKLGQLLKVKHGYAFKGKSFTTEVNDNLLLTPGNFEKDGGIKFNWGKQKFYQGKFPVEYVLQKNSLVIAMTDLTQACDILGAPLLIKDSKFNYLHNQRLGLVQENDQLVSKIFLYYYFNSRIYRDRLVATKTGSTVSHTAPERIYDCDINLPPLKEQKSIASILSALDDKIELNLQMNKTLEEMAMALYKHWFVDFGPFQDGEFVDSELGEIPKGWEVKQLKDFALLIMGQSPKSEFYNENKEGLPFHQGVKDYGIRFPTDITYSTAGNREAVKGDILFSVRAPVGRINVAKNKIILGRGLAAIRMPNFNSFMFYALRRMFTTEDSIGSGTVFNSVNKADLNNLKFILPPENQLLNFKNLVDPLDQQYLNNSKENITLTQLRDTLLPKLISGEVRVKDVEKIVTEVL